MDERSGQYLAGGKAFVFSNGVNADMADFCFLLQRLDGDEDWKVGSIGLGPTRRENVGPKPGLEKSKWGSYALRTDRSLNRCLLYAARKE